MKSKSKDLIKPVPAKKVSLRRVLNKNKKIKKNVKDAASDLNSVNEVLNQEIKVNTPVQAIEDAITLNEDVEHKVAKAADDLHQVNIELAKEVDERVVIESELADTKTDLADVEHKVARVADDLHQINIKLAKEVDKRVVIESELADTKTDLANVRDDLSKSQAKEEETRKFTLHDALTGLPNRVLFEQHLEQGLIQAKRHGWGLAVLFIDIDKFKSINDSYGHDQGDKVLLMVANRLQSLVRDEDTVSRWGGDEFMCLLLEVKQEAEVARLAEKMVNRLAEDFEFNGIVISIRASIGIAIYPAHGETADILFKNADAAMFKAKGTERRVMLFRQSTFD